MSIVELQDVARIESFLRRDAALHVYALADLDARFWPLTEWYGLEVGGELVAVAFVFKPLVPPVVYAVSPPRHAPTAELLGALAGRLPAIFWADVAPGLERCLLPTHEPGPGRVNYKMVREAGDGPTLEHACSRLTAADAKELAGFYRERAYAPGEEVGRYFDPYMLEIVPFFGIRDRKRLVAAGGFHVKSPQRRVAAVGNIATDPVHRDRGYARRITAALCESVGDQIDMIGLNVARDNLPAIGLYRSLGFRVAGEFVEQLFTRREAPR